MTATDLHEMEHISTETNTIFQDVLAVRPGNKIPAKPLVSSEPHKFLTFNLGAKLYGLTADLVEEISNPLPVTRLPGSPSGVSGIAPLRDEILAVIDLRQMLKEQNLTLSNRSKFIIARSDLAEMRVAIPVDRVREMFDCGSGDDEVNIVSEDSLVFGTAFANEVECHLIDPYKLWSALWADSSI